MKNVFLFAFSAILFIACGDDDNNSPGSDYFTYDGNSYSTNLLFREIYESGDVGLIVLGDASFNSTTGEIEGNDIDGILFDFEFDLSDGVNVPEGTYYFNEDDETEDTFFGELFINANANTDEGTFYDISDGTVTVDREGSDYILDYSIRANGRQINGYFKGEIDYDI